MNKDRELHLCLQLPIYSLSWRYPEMITSKSNDRMKQIQKLQTSRRARTESGLFVVEGLRIFREIPKELLVSVYMTEAFYSKNAELADDLEYELVSDPVMKLIADTQTPQGILAVVAKPVWTFDQVTGGSCPCLLVLENLQDPGNLGTIIRTAEAAEVTGLVLSEDCVDVFSPKVVRSTMGSIFRMPFIYEENILDVVASLHDMQIDTFAAHLSGNNFYEKNYKTKCAFLIGNEGNGLSDALSHLATHKIKIPMGGNIESLNAAIATTVLIYEAMRQRKM